MIDTNKKLYTNLGYRVTITYIGDVELQGVIESSLQLESWDKEGKHKSGDPDFDLTNKISSFKNKRIIKKKIS
jgi:hypothetical protein